MLYKRRDYKARIRQCHSVTSKQLMPVYAGYGLNLAGVNGIETRQRRSGRGKERILGEILFGRARWDMARIRLDQMHEQIYSDNFYR